MHMQQPIVDQFFTLNFALIFPKGEPLKGVIRVISNVLSCETSVYNM